MPAPKIPDDSVPAARFEPCLAKLFVTEGGLVNHPADRGGPTNFGISLKLLRAEAGDPVVRAVLGHGRPAVEDDVRKLTRSDAARLYRALFWDRHRCGELPVPLDGAVFDQVVNGGGAKSLQRTLNLFLHGAPGAALKIDGVIGDATIAAVRLVQSTRRASATQLVISFQTIVEQRYRDIVAGDPSQKVFLKGWLRRARSLGDV